MARADIRRTPSAGSVQYLTTIAGDANEECATSSNNQAESAPRLLLELPPELRLHIYEHLFASLRDVKSLQSHNAAALPDLNGPCKIVQYRFLSLDAVESFNSYRNAAFPSLMRTSSFLRREATPQFCQHLANMKTDLLRELRVVLRYQVLRAKQQAQTHLRSMQMHSLERLETRVQLDRETRAATKTERTLQAMNDQVEIVLKAI